jgi:hypothetical protein
VKLRVSESEFDYFNTGDKNQLYLAVYDLRMLTTLDASLGMATTLLVCIVLGAGAMVFSKQTNDLVLHPIEAMM